MAAHAPDSSQMEEGFDNLVDRATGLRRVGERKILALVGPPASGKSTLAAALAEAIGDVAGVVGMDGFHLANGQLKRLGRLDRKGAIDTFDADGYVSLLQRCVIGRDQVVYAPVFDRGLDLAIAGAVAIDRSVELVITEGNYLLDSDSPWNKVASYAAESWYCELDEAVRLNRLVTRHMAFGRTRAEAIDWIERSDQANARRIASYRDRADVVINMSSMGVKRSI